MSDTRRERAKVEAAPNILWGGTRATIEVARSSYFFVLIDGGGSLSQNGQNHIILRQDIFFIFDEIPVGIPWEVPYH